MPLKRWKCDSCGGTEFITPDLVTTDKTELVQCSSCGGIYEVVGQDRIVPHNRLPERPPFGSTSFATLPLRQGLRNYMIKYYSLEAFKVLCADLGVDHENLPATGKPGLIRELIRFMERRDAVERLRTTLNQ